MNLKLEDEILYNYDFKTYDGKKYIYPSEVLDTGEHVKKEIRWQLHLGQCFIVNCMKKKGYAPACVDPRKIDIDSIAYSKDQF